MGSECKNPSKRRYDITMSKRTRKPLNLGDSDGNGTMGSSRREAPDNLKGVVDQEEEEEEEEEENDHKSLKQLIKGDGRGRSSLGEHFTEEEKQQQLQLVKTQQQEGVQGVKFKGMVNRYVKVLSHLIKLKRDSRTIAASRKKPLLLAFYNTTN